MLLEVDNLSAGYAQSAVLHSVSIGVDAGEAVSLLGRNGVGKTTLVKTIMGLIKPRGGAVRFDGADISGARTHRIARSGIAYVPQGREVFAGLSVEENLVLGMGGRRKVPPYIYEVFPILERRARQKAGTMSGGEQQQLAIARALVADPKLVVLDEPSEGIQLTAVRMVRETLNRLRAELGLSILLVEQDLEFALDVGERGYVMEKGEIVAAGTRDELRDSDVVELYLTV
jgi:branched-chain amino acid transport system ATP-binding protein